MHDASFEQLRNLVFEAAPNPIIMVDGSGRLVLLNAQAEKLFGYRREELLGEPVERLLPERYRDGHPTLRAGFMAAPSARFMGLGRDLVCRCKDGREVPIEIGLSPVETPEGTFVIATVLDISERNRKEAELSHALEQAQERERTIRQQQEAIRELSTPTLQVRDRLLLLPIIGLLDSLRAKQLTDNLLQTIRANRAKVVVMDVTGVGTIDSKVANHLIQTIAAARLMGASVIITGLSADVAQALVGLGINLSGLNTVGDLQGGIEEAERLLGYKVSLVESSTPHVPARS